MMVTTKKGGIAAISAVSTIVRLLSLLLLFLLVVISPTSTAASGEESSGIDEGGEGAVFNVNYKFAGMERSLSALKAHDSLRHLQMLAGVDLPIGGTGRPDAVGLYYARIGIGTPSRDYYVQVDTGSDIMWVNCIQCTECPKKATMVWN